MSWLEWVVVGGAVLAAAVFSARRLMRALSGRGGCDCGLVRGRRPESCEGCRKCEDKRPNDGGPPR